LGVGGSLKVGCQQNLYGLSGFFGIQQVVHFLEVDEDRFVFMVDFAVFLHGFSLVWGGEGRVLMPDI